jgi:hypothetical protein
MLGMTPEFRNFMKCPLCDHRKGKRLCPAKNAVICAQCCGEKRILEIDCPESCEYLKAGRSREAQQAGARLARTDNPSQQARRVRVLTNFEAVIEELQTLIALERRSVRDLRDEDVVEALDCECKTLRTEDHGVIYETSSENLRAESLRRQIHSLIEALRYPKKFEGKRIHLQDALDCLEVLLSIVVSHIEAGPSALSFVDFLFRHLPRNVADGPSQSSIIVPG